MSQKKLAIFVEGYTESIFIERLLKEFFDENSIAISINDLSGGKRCPRIATVVSIEPTTANTRFKILIYNSCTDNRVLSDLKDRYIGLKANGYTQFIGIRDLYPDYTFEEKNDAINDNKGILARESIENTIFIFATMEVETWFIAETEHYQKIHSYLTLENIKQQCIDLESINNFEKDIDEPANKLNEIYQLVNFAYKKTNRQVSRTVESLDYENLYLNVKEEIPSLNKLFDTLEKFILEKT